MLKPAPEPVYKVKAVSLATMESTKKVVIAFDLYGTLLSTESIADELAKIYGGDRAQSLAAVWRRYQLEYTWRINSMGWSGISLAYKLMESGRV